MEALNHKHRKVQRNMNEGITREHLRKAAVIWYQDKYLLKPKAGLSE